MGKSRLKSKFLSTSYGPGKSVRPTSYKNTLVWQWLQFVTAGSDSCGTAILAMRRRVDMPNQFPHQTYLRNYLLNRCKLNADLVERTHVRLWNLYAEYRDAALRSVEPIRKGTTRNSWKEDDVGISTVGSDDKFLSR